MQRCDDPTVTLPAKEPSAMPNQLLERSLELTFPEGLVGYPEWSRFILEELPDGGPVAMLQSQDVKEISFLVTVPRLVCPSYAFDTPASVRQLLGLSAGQDPAALCMLVVRQDPLVITANLLGPLLYNPATGLAYQLVLSSSTYSAQHPVVPRGPGSRGD